MTLKQTTVVVDKEKWELLKARGYKLQDIVDNAFNSLLKIDLNDTLELNKELNTLQENKKMLYNDLGFLNKEFKNKGDLMDEKYSSEKNLLVEEYSKKINEVETEITDINFRIKSIKETIAKNESKVEEDKKLAEEKLAEQRQQNKSYNNILERYIIYVKSGGETISEFFEHDPECIEYCKTYGMELEELSKKVHEHYIDLS